MLSPRAQRGRPRAWLALAGEIERLHGVLARLLQAASDQIRLAEVDDYRHQIPRSPNGDQLLHPVCCQRETRGDAPNQGIRQAKGGGQFRHRAATASWHSAMPCSSIWRRPLDIPLTQIQHAHAVARLNQAEGMRDAFGDPQSLFGQGGAPA